MSPDLSSHTAADVTAAEQPAAAADVTVAEASTSFGRIALASCAGTTIELYDFFIYGTAAALVFPKLFFPALGESAAAVASLATLGVAFIARPLGAVICGHFGDRIGRKNTLILTLMLMGCATVAVGLIPPASVIGVWAPITVTVLRFLQGVAVGGEWAGAALLAVEYAPPGRRGLYAAFPQLGPSLGFLLSSATFLAVDFVVGSGSRAFLDYGWRIPFLASGILVILGLYVRRSVAETPEFQRYLADINEAGRDHRYATPLREVLSKQWREVVLGGGVVTVLLAMFFVATVTLTTYGTTPDGPHLARSSVFLLGMLGSFVMVVTTITASMVGDRTGRRKLIMTGFTVTAVVIPVLFAWLAGDTAAAFALTLVGMLALCGVSYGPVGAFLPQLFRTQYRYTGAGVAYNLGGILGGGVAPILAAALVGAYGISAVGSLLAALAVLSLISSTAVRAASS